MSNDVLTELRKQIDEIDHKIVTLLGERIAVVKKVGKYKKLNNIAPLAEDRWQAVLQSKMELAKKAGLDPEVVKDLYNRIHEYALLLEEEVEE